MSDLEILKEQNRELARKINEEALANPDSPYAGKFVGIANGQVVVVGDNLDKVARELDRIEPEGERTFFIEAGLDYTKVHYIWGDF
jgi:hypothetical protein